MVAKKNNLIEKSNSLNTLMCDEMTLTEFRFFCLYLSKLNAREPNKRTANISIKEFENFFDVQINTYRFNTEIRKIMSRTIEIIDNGHKIILTLYSKFRYKIDDPKILEITCNDELLPYLFELKKNYTTYVIGNIAKLNSVAKIRLYEICKQYEKIGMIKFELSELQKMMCVNVAEFRDFRSKRLEPAIKDINQYTDIELSYEKILQCRKVVALKLIIKSKKDRLMVEEPEPIPIPISTSYSPELESLYYKCNEEYTMEQLQNILNIVTSSNILEVTKTTAPNYIFNVYSRIKASCQDVHSMYKYTLGVISKDTEHSDSNNRLQEVLKMPNKKETSYDVEEYQDFIRTTKRLMGG